MHTLSETLLWLRAAFRPETLKSACNLSDMADLERSRPPFHVKIEGCTKLDSSPRAFATSVNIAVTRGNLAWLR